MRPSSRLEPETNEASFNWFKKQNKLISHGSQHNSDLIQLVRFVELIHSDLNSIFDMSIVFMTNYSFSERRCPRQQRDALDDRLCES
jgi:hypothetical protein